MTLFRVTLIDAVIVACAAFCRRLLIVSALDLVTWTCSPVVVFAGSHHLRGYHGDCVVAPFA